MIGILSSIFWRLSNEGFEKFIKQGTDAIEL
jgi:hypothetical protein